MPNPQSFSRLPTVMSRFSLSRSMIYKLISAGRFPPLLKIGNASVWSDAELDQYASTLTAGRNETREAV